MTAARLVSSGDDLRSLRFRSMQHKKLANIILSSPLTDSDIRERLSGLLVDERALDGFIERMLQHFGEGNRPSISALTDWVQQDQEQERNEEDEEHYEEDEPEEELKVILNGNFDQTTARMSPDRHLSAYWKVPSITTLGALAHWLNIPVEHLDWYCGQLRPADIGSKLSHYHIVLIPKKSGGTRLLEVPKWELKQSQRYVLDGILEHIPTHPCSHGFQKNRSIISYVKPHLGKEVIIKFDLKDYFISAGRTRVRSLFHLAGYPPKISKYLAHLCTHGFKGNQLAPSLRVPSLRHWKYERPHLPQGAPSSPAIADRLLYKLDVRLSKLAEKLNMNYTRYADDMAFSSSEKISRSQLEHIKELVKKIITDEGWWLNTEKTRVMHQSQRQRLAGLIVNTKANVARAEYDTLKAILFRVKRNGLDAENRSQHPHFEEYLRGRVAFISMVNPRRGEKLFQMLEDTLSR